MILVLCLNQKTFTLTKISGILFKGSKLLKVFYRFKYFIFTSSWEVIRGTPRCTCALLRNSKELF